MLPRGAAVRGVLLALLPICHAFRLIRSVGSHGSALGELNGPRHIAPLAGGGVAVVDGMNERVQLFDAEARAVSSIDGLVSPTGLAIAGDALYVSESTGGHRISRYRLSDGSFLGMMGRFGMRPGELHDPQCLTVAGELLLVAEWGNNRISVFNRTNLAFVRHLGGDEFEVDEGDLDQPCGVAVHEGEVFVADTWNHRISVFALDTGEFLRTFGTRGSAPGKFSYPMGITVANGQLYVAERTGKRLQKLTLEGEPLDELASPCGGWLYGVCVDGERVWLTGSACHAMHLLEGEAEG